MNKKQLAAHIAAKDGITKESATKLIQTVLDGIASGLKQGKLRVRLDGFGTFSVSTTKPRIYTSPKGVESALQERTKIKFKAHADLHNDIVR